MNENYQSGLNRLIQELCPDGVEYGKLGDFATVLYGYPCDASKFNTDFEGVPVIRIRDVMPGTTETYTTDSIPEQYIIHKDDFLVGMDGNFNCGKWKSEDGFLCQRVCRIKSADNNILLDGFLFHFLGPAFKKIEDKKLGGTVKHLSAKDVNDIQIPLPPMEVQREIARILDTITELTAELTSELTVRKTQYEYYRDRMLKFDNTHPLNAMLRKLCPDGVEYKKLGELGNFYGGLTGKSKDDFSDGNAIFISYRNVYSNPALDIHPIDKVKIAEGEKQRTLKYGDVIFTGSSETPDECGFSSVVTTNPTEDLYLNSFCFFFRFDDLSIIDPNFAKHLFRSGDLRYQIGKTASGVTRFNVSKEKMAKVVIPIPPIEVQQEIVRILDSFSTLIESISDGIPAEIEARQQQYEYYRDKLLQFEKKN